LKKGVTRAKVSKQQKPDSGERDGGQRADTNTRQKEDTFSHKSLRGRLKVDRPALLTLDELEDEDSPALKPPFDPEATKKEAKYVKAKRKRCKQKKIEPETKEQSQHNETRPADLFELGAPEDDEECVAPTPKPGPETRKKANIGANRQRQQTKR